MELITHYLLVFRVNSTEEECRKDSGNVRKGTYSYFNKNALHAGKIIYNWI